MYTHIFILLFFSVTSKTQTHIHTYFKSKLLRIRIMFKDRHWNDIHVHGTIYQSNRINFETSFTMNSKPNANNLANGCAWETTHQRDDISTARSFNWATNHIKITVSRWCIHKHNAKKIAWRLAPYCWYWCYCCCLLFWFDCKMWYRTMNAPQLKFRLGRKLNESDLLIRNESTVISMCFLVCFFFFFFAIYFNQTCNILFDRVKLCYMYVWFNVVIRLFTIVYVSMVNVIES